MAMSRLVRWFVAALSITAVAATSSAEDLPCSSLINFRTYGTAAPGEMVTVQLELINAQGSILSRRFVSGEWTEWVDTGLTESSFIGDLCGGQVQYMYKWRSYCPGAPEGFSYVMAYSAEWGPWQPQLEMRTVPERPIEGEAFDVYATIPNLPSQVYNLQTKYELSSDAGRTWSQGPSVEPWWTNGTGERLIYSDRSWTQLVRVRVDVCGNSYITAPSLPAVPWIPQLEMRTIPERPVEGEEFQVLGRLANLPTFSWGAESYVLYETSYDGGVTWNLAGNGMRTTRDWSVLRTERQGLPGYLARLRLDWRNNTYTSAPSQPPVPWVPDVQVWTEPAVPVAGQNLTLFARTTNRPTFGATWVNYHFYASDDRGATWSYLGHGNAESIFTPPTQFLVSGSSVTPGRQFRIALQGLPGYDASVIVEVPSLCPADLNADSFVDDADFVLFATAYNLLLCSDPAMPASCPADLNGDGGVDDADFVTFATAYNELVCP